MLISQELTLDQRDFERFRQLIYRLAGIALSEAKQCFVQGRLAKRLRALSLDSYTAYYDLLADGANKEESTRFINALTTNKTDFFREDHHFQFLKEKVFPNLKSKSTEGGNRKLRIWCSASSTGEEPYSIAMTALDFFGFNSGWDIRILASDIDTDVLEAAATGIYTADRIVDIPKPQLQIYFERQSRAVDASYRAKDILRNLITFRRINLQDAEWPINTTFDVIFCRNVMIYFDSSSQTKIVNHFAEKLNSDGYLIIGHSESLVGLTDVYKPLGDTVYRLNPAHATAHAKSSASIKLQPSPTVSTDRPAARPANRSASGPQAIARCVPPQVSATGNHSTDNTKIPSQSLEKHPIIVGELHASREPIIITTLLGSCVAACLYDEDAGVGGMNHFMLPESKTNPSISASFGVHAMEMLINAIMKLGGNRKRLKAKLFGGGRVVRATHERWNVGARNVEFAMSFLDTERIPLVAERTGGELGMNVQFNTRTAKVLVRLLDSKTSKQIDIEQKQVAAKSVKTQLEHEDVTLF